jgi:hypothetical protein
MYSFNYPLLGIDFIFSGEHRLEKVMLHNPQPWHDTFLKYQRCNFTVKSPWTLDPSDTASPLEHVLNNGYMWGDDDDACSEAQSVKPLISSTGCSNGLVLKIYAFHGIAIYVMPSLHRVVKVLLFDKGLATRGRVAPPLMSQAVLPPAAAPVTSNSIEAFDNDDGEAESPMQRPQTSSPDQTEPTSPPTRSRRLHVDPTEDVVRVPPLPPLVDDSDNGEMVEPGALPSNSAEGSSPLEVRERTTAYSPSSRDGVNDDDDQGKQQVERYYEDEDDEQPRDEEEDRKALMREADEAAFAVGAPSTHVELAEEVTEGEAFSVPPPMPELVEHRHHDESEEHYTDDFEASSRHFSARSSSWTPSAHRSPTLAPHAEGQGEEDISDERWGFAARGEDDTTTPENAAEDTAEEAVGAATGGDAGGDDGVPTPSPRASPSPANRSVTSTSSNSKKKKGGKKKR